MRRSKYFDMPLFLCTLLLAGIGIVFIYSASYPKALVSEETGHNSLFFAEHQMAFTIVGLLLLMVCQYISLDRLRRLFWWIAGIAGFLLVITLVISRAKHGHQSYLEFGPVQFMPSEFAKIAVVLTMATYLATYPRRLQTWKGMWSGPYWFWFIPIGMIALEQDLGTVLVMGAAIGTMLLIAGAKFRFIAIPVVIVLLLGCLVGISGHLPTRVNTRFAALVNPTDLTNPASYHPYNSLIAVGSGGVLGKGICQSCQKWFYLPACQNDYIFAIVCEEMGFVGTVLLIIIPFAVLIFLGFSVAHRAPDAYSAMVAAGCTVMLGTPMFVNMGMVLNCLPSVGINLPFISYGGSSIISSLLLVGLLLNVSSLRGQPPVAETAAPQPANA